MTPPYSTSARLTASRFPRTDGLEEDRNGRATLLLAVVVVVLVVVGRLTFSCHVFCTRPAVSLGRPVENTCCSAHVLLYLEVDLSKNA